MDICIYYAYFEKLPDEKFAALLNDLPQNIQERIKKFRRWQDAHAVLMGRQLLSRILSDEHLGLGLDNVMYSSTGRPYFNEAIDFSISHSANIAVCAVSTGSKIGIDVELITDLDINDYRTIFTEKEWNEIINAVNPLVTFYRYWTIKECILKADGAGIGELASLEITNKQIKFKDNEWQVEEIFLETNYVCHIAFPNRPASMNIRKIVF